MSIPYVLEDMPRYTAWGAIVQTAKMAGAPMPIIDQTTLNEKFNFFPDDEGDHSKTPDLNYWMIGYGSTYSRMNSATPPVEEGVNYVHDPLDAVVFHSCPIVLREQGKDDLSPEQRAKLAGRCIIEHEGRSYVAYMLAAIDRSATVITAEVVTPPASDDPNGVATRETIVGDPSYLNPIPRKLTDDTVRKDGAYIDITCPLGLVLDSWMIKEAINAKRILTNSPLEITEVSLVSAYTKSKTVVDASNTITYDEAIEAQVAMYAPTRVITAHYADDGLSMQQDVGIDSPTNFARPF